MHKQRDRRTIIPGVLSGAAGDVMEIFTVGFKNCGKSLVGILWMYLFAFLWSL